MKELDPAEPYPADPDHGDAILLKPMLAAGRERVKTFCSGCERWFSRKDFDDHEDHGETEMPTHTGAGCIYVEDTGKDYNPDFGTITTTVEIDASDTVERIEEASELMENAEPETVRDYRKVLEKVLQLLGNDLEK